VVSERLHKPLRVMRLSDLPLGLRSELVTLPLQFRLHGHPLYERVTGRLRARREAAEQGDRRIALGGVDVFMPAGRARADLGTLYEVFASEDYATDYRDAVVVDLGGHKGYFGAYAILHGAAAVLSYEPASANFGFLERAARSLDGSRAAQQWRVFNSAVGAEAGTAELHVSPDSWTHSLIDRPGFTDGAETISIVPMTDALDEARALAGERRIVVKMDIEGGECDVVAGTPVEAWHGVDEVFVELHGFASCSAADVVGRLGQAGLSPVDPVAPENRDGAETDHDVLHLRRQRS
jgi:FkbM family methyltransferase